jgi:diguanylate cyclase (GGDEF)-like protein
LTITVFNNRGVTVSVSLPIAEAVEGRKMFVFAALVVFVLVTSGLYYGIYDASARAAALFLVTIWLGGLIGTLLLPGAASDRMTLTRAVWGNCGAVAIALLAPDVVRILMLSLPLFGVLYAALQLSREQVRAVTTSTLVAYVICAMALYAPGVTNLDFELMFGGAFTVLIFGMHVMAIEVVRILQADRERTKQLNRALRQVSDQAMRDELTGLYNRRYLQDVLERQKALADRGQLDFTVCFCDLDLFKRVNDRFGHAEGDRVLRRFAKLAEHVVRSVDLVARWGGEEFLLVLVGADATVAAQVAERLRRQTRSMSVGDDRDYSLTVSIGVATFVPGETIEHLISRSDRALYAAKAQGRDRVLISR